VINIKRKKKWIALSENTYELLKNQGEFLESFDDVVSKLLIKNNSSRQSLGIGEP
jgi:hypothetical protein